MKKTVSRKFLDLVTIPTLQLTSTHFQLTYTQPSSTLQLAASSPPTNIPQINVAIRHGFKQGHGGIFRERNFKSQYCSRKYTHKSYPHEMTQQQSVHSRSDYRFKYCPRLNIVLFTTFGMRRLGMWSISSRVTSKDNLISFSYFVFC